MNCPTQSCRTRLLLAALALSVPLLSVSPAPADDGDSGKVIRPNGKNLKVYQDLSAAWWNWALAEPEATNPVVDSTGEFGHLGQSGSVWFLAGTFGGPVTRTITIPEGKHIFFPISNFVAWFPEDGATEAEIRAIANENVDLTTVLECSIDGKPVKKLFQKHRAETPAFTLSLPPGGLLDDIGAFPPGDRFPAVSDGYWVLLRPLSPGQHTIHFLGVVGDPEAPIFVTEATYNITVE